MWWQPTLRAPCHIIEFFTENGANKCKRTFLGSLSMMSDVAKVAERTGTLTLTMYIEPAERAQDVARVRTHLNEALLEVPLQSESTAHSADGAQG
jgi:hypothetical protein